MIKIPTKLRKPELNKIIAILLIFVLSFVGVKLLTQSHAQSPYVNIEAESGNLTTPASINGDNLSSNAKNVVFGNVNDPSGQSVPIGNQTNFKQVFYDNFADENVPLGSFSGCVRASTQYCSGLPKTCNTSTGFCSSLPTTGPQSKWWDYPDGWLDTQKDCQYMPSQTMSISSGVMNMFIHTNSAGTCMTAVPEAKIPNGSLSDGQLYGMYSVRFRSDPIPGYKTAFLLWPDSETWPRDGEIDWPEGNLTGSMGAHMHKQNATSGSQQDNFSSTATYPSWHTATTVWTPTYVKFIMDGVVIGISTSSIPNTPMHWVLQTESELNTTTKPAASAQGNLQVDWVSVWAYDPSIL